METLNAIASRRSIRTYKQTPIGKDIIEKLIDAGRRAPTARAIEPWEFVAITERSNLERVGDMTDTGKFIKNAACCIAIFCRDTKYFLEDGCAATENILLAAEDLGLGACWVAGDKKPFVEAVSEFLGAGKDLKLISLISVGWPNESKIQQKKRGLKEVIHWEKF